jgi:predicted MPP superfamily phosphohydrolase
VSRTQFFLLFFSIVFTIFLLLQAYAFRRYAQWIRRAFVHSTLRTWRAAGWILFSGGNLLIVLAVVFRSRFFSDNPVAQRIISYSSGLYFSSIITAALILLVRDVIRLVLFWVRRGIRLISQLAQGESTTVVPEEEPPVDVHRRGLIRSGGLAVLGATFGAPVLSAFTQVHDYRIIRRTLIFPNLPSGLRGFTMAQVSDIHAGVYMSESDIKEIVDLTNSLKAEVLFVTGDFVDSSDDQIPSLRTTLNKLQAEYGVFGCLGNHDHFATAALVSAAMEDAGIRMLNNAHHTLSVNGERLSIVGVDDAGSGIRNFARMDEAVAGLEPESFKILMSHHPDFFQAARRAGMDLTLAGHTHGGQV